MRPSLTFPISWIISLALSVFLFQCAPPDASGGGIATETGVGGSATDESEIPGETSGQASRRYDADQNQLTPEKHEFFEFYTRQKPFPFNANAIKSSGIRQAEVRQYTSVDNDFLEEDTPEEELELSRRFRFRFDNAGQVDHFERLALVVGDPLDSARMEFTYTDGGELSAVFGVSVLGPIDGKAEFAEGRIVEWNESAALSISYRYDEEGNQVYETRYTGNGNAIVVVKSKKDLGEESMLEIVDDILARESPFVNYAVAPNLNQVYFEVESAGKIVTTYEFGGRGRMEGVHRYSYDQEALAHDKFTEKGESGRQTTRNYHYTSQGDLEKVVFNEVDPGQTGLSSAHHFFYDENGRWIKRVFSSNMPTGNPRVERVDFVKYSN